MATATQSTRTRSIHNAHRAGRFTEPSRPQFRIANLVLATLRLWTQRMRERHELAAMSDLELQDIGMTRSERTCLIKLVFWKEWRRSTDGAPHA